VSQVTATVLVAAKTATVVFGGVLTLLSYRAFRRTGSPALRALTAGIGLLVVGAALGGLLHQGVGLSLAASVSVQSAFAAAGFAVMTYSLYIDVPAPTSRTGSGTDTGD